MAQTPDLDLNILIRADRGDGLSQTLSSLEVIPRAERLRVEVIIADVAGDAETEQTIRQFVASGRFAIHNVLRMTEVGAAATWNQAMRSGRGVWVLRLEAGDELITDPLPFLERHPAATSVHFTIEQARGRGWRRRRPARLRSRTCLGRLTASNPIVTPALIYRRAFATHPFDETLVHLYDWAFWLLNRDLFERAAWEPKVVLAKVRRAPVDPDRLDAGPDRARIGDRMANRLRFKLPRKQRNNLRMHHICGLRQQGQRAPFFRTLVRLPCDSALYMRGLLYLLLGRSAAHR